MDQLTASWSSLKLDPEKLECFCRLWSIETGKIGHLYNLSEGVGMFSFVSVVCIHPVLFLSGHEVSGCNGILGIARASLQDTIDPQRGPAYIFVDFPEGGSILCFPNTDKVILFNDLNLGFGIGDGHS